MAASRSLVIGLTGGIGSGKSLVADLFVGLGAGLVDTDQIAHQLTSIGGAALPMIRETFGNAMLDTTGALNRPAMRAAVFADENVRQQLQNILHPLIREAALTALAKEGGTVPYVILAVPLLAEVGRQRYPCNRVLVVDCPEAMQIERVMARSGLQRSEVEAIMARQSTRVARLAIADDVLVNDDGIGQLRSQVKVLHARYQKLSEEYSSTD